MTAVVTSKFDSASAVNIKAYSPDVPGSPVWTDSQFNDASCTVGAGTGTATAAGVVFLYTGSTKAPGTGAIRHKIEGRNTASDGIIFVQVGNGEKGEAVGIQVSVSDVKVLRWGEGANNSSTTLLTRSDLSGPVGNYFKAESIYDELTNNLKTYFNGVKVFDDDAGPLKAPGSTSYRRAGIVIRNAEMKWSDFGNPGDPDPEGAADTTPPSLSGSITIGTVTSSSIAMSWPVASDNVAVTSYEVSKDGGTTWTDTANTATSYTFASLSPSTTYQLRVRAKDGAGLTSSPALAASQATTAGSDTSPPSLSGSITVSNVVPTGYSLSWPTGTDNVAVTAYEYSLDGGTIWLDNGLNTTKAVTGRTPTATDQVRVRARDAAGNVSIPPLSTSVTLPAAASITSEPLKDRAGNLLVNQALNFYAVYSDTTGALVTRKTGLSTNSAGVVTFSDPALTAGATYRHDYETSDGKRRMPRKAAA